MRPGSIVIDISCDEYSLNGILHYAVDHTPALLYRSAREAISEVVARYGNELVAGRLGDCLRKAMGMDRGMVMDQRISRFQNGAARIRGEEYRAPRPAPRPGAPGLPAEGR